MTAGWEKALRSLPSVSNHNSETEECVPVDHFRSRDKLNDDLTNARATVSCRSSIAEVADDPMELMKVKTPLLSTVI